ncbi:toll/interleukin-1 receptor domain-containing protein [bacterium]|nr:toll/interleukin-1 receptor domain-containing protein [bacterium]
MENSRIKEIVQLVKKIEAEIPMERSPEQSKLRLLFQQLRALSSVCMTGLDLRQELKDRIPVSELGKFYDSVRYVHETSTQFSSDRVPKLKESLSSIVTVFEGILHSCAPDPNSSIDIKAHQVRAFISYAKEDREIAKRLYTDIKNMGVSVWLDIEDLIPGQNWRSAIHNEIRACSYFIALLSSHSVSKRGYVQKELKTALEVLDEFPPSEIFIIPVRIDECAPSDERLRDIHFADLFPSYDEGLKKILQAISLSRDCPSAGTGSMPLKLKDIPDKEEDVTIFGKGVEHGCSEQDERQTYFVFSSTTSELTIDWYHRQETIHSSSSWQGFSKKPSFDPQKGQYRSPGWRTGNPGYKIKAVIKYLQREKELFWDSD